MTTYQDYTHTDTDVIFLSNQKGATVLINANDPSVTWKDLVIIYDEDVLYLKTVTPAITDRNAILEDIYGTFEK